MCGGGGGDGKGIVYCYKMKLTLSLLTKMDGVVLIFLNNSFISLTRSYMAFVEFNVKRRL